MKNSLTNANPSGRDIQSGSGGHNEFRNLISHFWNFFDNPTADSDLEPKIEVSENKNSVTVSAELPGIEEKDIDVQISSDGYLSISGEKRHQSEENNKGNYFSEISYGMFRRTIPLPWDLDYDKANADYDDGVLKVVLPKSQTEQQKFKKINVKKANALRKTKTETTTRPYFGKAFFLFRICPVMRTALAAMIIKPPAMMFQVRPTCRNATSKHMPVTGSSSIIIPIAAAETSLLPAKEKDWATHRQMRRKNKSHPQFSGMTKRNRKTGLSVPHNAAAR